MTKVEQRSPALQFSKSPWDSLPFNTAQQFAASLESSSTDGSRLDDLHLTPLLGGLSQTPLFRFELKGHTYVLRVLSSKASTLEKKRQIFLMTNAGKVGIGPKILYVNPNLDSLVMDFIPGSTISSEIFKNMSHLMEFAQSLRKLHNSTIPFPVAFSPFSRFREFLEKGQELKAGYPSEMIRVKSLIAKIEQTVNLHPIPNRPTHLDLHSLNILLDKNRFYLVDWVNGGMCDPFMDLATFTTFQNFDNGQIQAFLKEYLNRVPSSLEWDRLKILQPVRLFVIATNLLGNSLTGIPISESNQLLQDSKLPSFESFIQTHSLGLLDWSFRQLGYVLFKHGLHLVSQPSFKESLQRLQLES